MDLLSQLIIQALSSPYTCNKDVVVWSYVNRHEQQVLRRLQVMAGTASLLVEYVTRSGGSLGGHTGFRHLRVCRNWGPCSGVLPIRILVYSGLYAGPSFLETLISA